MRGDGRGRGLGFATANLQPPPRSGAARASASTPGGRTCPTSSRPAAISVGYNPTFSDARDRVRIEAHLLDFDRDVYGRPLRLELLRRLRGEERFGSVEELVAAGAPRHRRRAGGARRLASLSRHGAGCSRPGTARAYSVRTASGCSPSASTRKARPPSRSLTASASSVPSNTSATPSSAAHPGGSSPPATQRR